MAKKKGRWLKFRHKIVRNLAYIVLYPYSKIKYGVKIEKFKEQKKRPYFIVLNHQTPFDQFFVGMAFRGPVYYVATEDIFSLGFISSIIRYVIAPIPIRKQTTDVKAVMTCLRVAKEGGTIAIAPEGNRTYSGKTEYMNPAIAPLVKKLNLPLAIFRVEGGYGAEPRWSDVVRKGKMKAYVAQVIEPEEYSALSNDELYERIKAGLFVDEAKADNEYPHKKCAQYLERAMYVCPFCGLSEFESKNDIVHCKKCGSKIKYTAKKELKGINCDFPFPFVSQWYDYQADFISRLDLSGYTDKPLYKDNAEVREVIVFKNKKRLFKNAEIVLYSDRLDINGEIYPFEKISAVTVLGRNKLNIYFCDKVYQLKGSKRFNALKYVHIYHRHKSIASGKGEEVFLGI